MAKPEKMTSLTVFIVLAKKGDVSRSPRHSYGKTRRIPGFFDLSSWEPKVPPPKLEIRP